MTDILAQNPFDGMRRFRPDGSEFWSARDLMAALGYSKWERFADALDRAQTSCGIQGHNPADHFPGAGKMVGIGSKTEREVLDFHLSRYACYLTAMNGDPRKPEIAAAQAYFVQQTRRAELFEAAPQTTAPALITASAIGASLGKSRNAVLNELSRRKHIAPVACGISHGTHTACYLFPLDRVTAAYADAELLAPFQSYTGHVTKGPSAALNNARRGVQTRMGQRALPRGLRELDVDTLGRVIAVAIKAALA